MRDYQAFLESKRISAPPVGIEPPGDLNAALFEFQRDIVRWALKRGRAAIFADCGLGKTLMQLEWARHIPGDVLILAPLAVAAQTAREGERFGIDVTVCRSQDDVRPGINITNYEMLQHFDPGAFVGIVLDESSILKAYNGKTRTHIIEAFRETKYRLACTATPAPNDHMELGNHAEFLGIMTRAEMLAMFFVHDGGETQKWRIKGHAQEEFWKWLASWAVMLRKPSDLGYDDAGFALPEFVMHEVTVSVERPSDGYLFPVEAQTLQERLRERRNTLVERVKHCADIVNGSDEQFIIWCNLNAEADALKAGVHVYAPIAYTHPLSEIAGIDHSWNTWAEFDRKFIEACGELWVAMLVGWRESVGVAAEIEIARALGKPVRYVRPDTLAIWEEPA